MKYKIIFWQLIATLFLLSTVIASNFVVNVGLKLARRRRLEKSSNVGLFRRSFPVSHVDYLGNATERTRDCHFLVEEMKDLIPISVLREEAVDCCQVASMEHELFYIYKYEAECKFKHEKTNEEFREVSIDLCVKRRSRERERQMARAESELRDCVSLYAMQSDDVIPEGSEARVSLSSECASRGRFWVAPASGRSQCCRSRAGRVAASSGAPKSSCPQGFREYKGFATLQTPSGSVRRKRAAESYDVHLDSNGLEECFKFFTPGDFKPFFPTSGQYLAEKEKLKCKPNRLCNLDVLYGDSGGEYIEYKEYLWLTKYQPLDSRFLCSINGIRPTGFFYSKTFPQSKCRNMPLMKSESKDLETGIMYKAVSGYCDPELYRLIGGKVGSLHEDDEVCLISQIYSSRTPRGCKNDNCQPATFCSKNYANKAQQLLFEGAKHFNSILPSKARACISNATCPDGQVCRPIIGDNGDEYGICGGFTPPTTTELLPALTGRITPAPDNIDEVKGPGGAEGDVCSAYAYSGGQNASDTVLRGCESGLLCDTTRTFCIGATKPGNVTFFPPKEAVCAAGAVSEAKCDAYHAKLAACVLERKTNYNVAVGVCTQQPRTKRAAVDPTTFTSCNVDATSGQEVENFGPVCASTLLFGCNADVRHCIGKTDVCRIDGELTNVVCGVGCNETNVPTSSNSITGLCQPFEVQYVLEDAADICLSPYDILSARNRKHCANGAICSARSYCGKDTPLAKYKRAHPTQECQANGNCQGEGETCLSELTMTHNGDYFGRCEWPLCSEAGTSTSLPAPDPSHLTHCERQSGAMCELGKMFCRTAALSAAFVSNNNYKLPRSAAGCRTASDCAAGIPCEPIIGLEHNIQLGRCKVGLTAASICRVNMDTGEYVDVETCEDGTGCNIDIRTCEKYSSTQPLTDKSKICYLDGAWLDDTSCGSATCDIHQIVGMSKDPLQGGPTINVVFGICSTIRERTVEVDDICSRAGFTTSAIDRHNCPSGYECTSRKYCVHLPPMASTMTGMPIIDCDNDESCGPRKQCIETTMFSGDRLGECTLLAIPGEVCSKPGDSGLHVPPAHFKSCAAGLLCDTTVRFCSDKLGSKFDYVNGFKRPEATAICTTDGDCGGGGTCQMVTSHTEGGTLYGIALGRCKADTDGTLGALCAVKEGGVVEGVEPSLICKPTLACDPGHLLCYETPPSTNVPKNCTAASTCDTPNASCRRHTAADGDMMYGLCVAPSKTTVALTKPCMVSRPGKPPSPRNGLICEGEDRSCVWTKFCLPTPFDSRTRDLVNAATVPCTEDGDCAATAGLSCQEAKTHNNDTFGTCEMKGKQDSLCAVVVIDGHLDEYLPPQCAPNWQCDLTKKVCLTPAQKNDPGLRLTSSDFCNGTCASGDAVCDHLYSGSNHLKENDIVSMPRLWFGTCIPACVDLNLHCMYLGTRKEACAQWSAYLGPKTSTNSGSQCYGADEAAEKGNQYHNHWEFRQQLREGVCRNPDGDPKGPYCYGIGSYYYCFQNCPDMTNQEDVGTLDGHCSLNYAEHSPVEICTGSDLGCNIDVNHCIPYGEELKTNVLCSQNGSICRTWQEQECKQHSGPVSFNATFNIVMGQCRATTTTNVLTGQMCLHPVAQSPRDARRCPNEDYCAPAAFCVPKLPPQGYTEESRINMVVQIPDDAQVCGSDIDCGPMKQCVKPNTHNGDSYGICTTPGVLGALCAVNTGGAYDGVDPNLQCKSPLACNPDMLFCLAPSATAIGPQCTEGQNCAAPNATCMKQTIAISGQFYGQCIAHPDNATVDLTKPCMVSRPGMPQSPRDGQMCESDNGDRSCVWTKFCLATPLNSRTRELVTASTVPCTGDENCTTEGLTCQEAKTHNNDTFGTCEMKGRRDAVIMLLMLRMTCLTAMCLSFVQSSLQPG